MKSFIDFRRLSHKSFILLTVLLLVFPAPPFISAATEGNYASKDEVVYATLSPDGEGMEFYVVNVFDVKKAGNLTDFGSYNEIKNLTDLTEIKENNGTIEFTASEGKFYYQGNLEDTALPWDFSISYFLDGEKIKPEELAGKNGHVEMKITTAQNDEVNPVFYENYLLQISITLDPEIFTKIDAPDAMIANAGKNKLITFTVLPEKEAELTLEADVKNFELSGIEINGVPSTMAIDAPNFDDKLSEMDSLTKSILQVNNGVSELDKGVSELNRGVSELYNGSKEYNNGINEISDASSQLVEGSKAINKALKTINNSLSGENTGKELDLGDLQQLPKGLTLLSENLNTAADGLTSLRTGFSQAYHALDKAMNGIPSHEISPEEIQSLYAADIDHDVLNKLTETYSAALTAKGTYDKIKGGFDAVDKTLNELSNGLDEMGTQISSTAKEIETALTEMDIMESIEQLQNGISELSTKYNEFHNGLIEYTNGVSQLSNAYGDIHNGFGQVFNGIGQLKNGTSELHNGTNQLYTATKDLPEQLQYEINEMISEFENTDFEAHSFISSKNNNKINTVQFILKTESIEIDEKDTEEEPVVEKKGFWDRLWSLFK